MARLSTAEATGPDPVLPEPRVSLVPTVRIAPAKGWPPGARPLAAAGTSVAAFATGLNHPRWLHVLPNGDVLVAETNAPPRPEEGKGVKGRIMTAVMKSRAPPGAAPTESRLRRDADGDGSAESRSVFLEGLNSPFGMALVGNALYVANTDAVMRFMYTPGATRITTPGVKVVDLPAGPRNHHWTKNLIASPDGSRLYVTVGSNSNVAEHGMQEEEGRAAVWEVDPRTGAHRIFASGLRNPNGLAWEPQSGALWTVVNERDELGSDLVPDYLTVVREGAFYGWPYSYYGSHVDQRVQPQRPELVAKAVRPDYSLGSHVAPLGLAFSKEGAFIGQHAPGTVSAGRLNVGVRSLRDGRPSGLPVEVLGGFLSRRTRPTGARRRRDTTRRGAACRRDDVGGVSGDGRR